MAVLYDDKYHMHFGYYEENCDYESIAFKRQSEEVWDVFFDYKGYGINNITPENELTIQPYGTRIFSIDKMKLIMKLEYSYLSDGYSLIK